MRPVILTTGQWKQIRMQLKEEHPTSVFMLRERMRIVLGFTVRDHQQWIAKPETAGDDMNYGYYQMQIHLDFYSEKKHTMFLMKFSEIINARNNGIV